MGFKPSVIQPKGNDDYETLVIDADTILIKAAITQQESYIIVTAKKNGKKKEFKTRTKFYGHHGKKDGGWLAERNEELTEKGKKNFTLEDFDIEDCVRIIGSADKGAMKFDIDLGKILHRLGLLCSDSGQLLRADSYFTKALRLYRKNDVNDERMIGVKRDKADNRSKLSLMNTPVNTTV